MKGLDGSYPSMIGQLSALLLRLLLVGLLATVIVACEESDTPVTTDDTGGGGTGPDPGTDPEAPIATTLSLQSVSPSTLLPSDGTPATVSFLILDQTGDPFQGATVIFSLSEGDGTTPPSGASLSTITATTDAAGVATVNLTAGPSPTLATITATSGSLSTSANITVDLTNTITFTSTTQNSLAIQGLPGETQANLVFTVIGQSGNPIANQLVEFSLGTFNGGAALGLDPASATTNNLGQVTIPLLSGDQPASLVVTATTDPDNDDATLNDISTQSQAIAVSTLLPVPSGFEIAVDILNPRSFDISGETINVTAFSRDSIGNPVEDGTQVNFFAEGGFIEPFCELSGGSCTVQWTGSSPRPSDGIATLFAFMIGSEDFSDNNNNFIFDAGDSQDVEPLIADIDGDGIYDPGDGDTFADWNRNGTRDTDANAGTYGDIAEPFGDYNNNGTFESGVDKIPDLDGDTERSLKDDAWTASLPIGASVDIDMSGDTVVFVGLPAAISVPVDTIASINFTIQDQNGRSLPFGTTIEASTVGDIGSAGDVFPAEIGSTRGPKPVSIDFEAGSDAGGGIFRVTVTPPDVVGQVISIPVTLTP